MRLGALLGTMTTRPTAAGSTAPQSVHPGEPQAVDKDKPRAVYTGKLQAVYTGKPQAPYTDKPQAVYADTPQALAEEAQRFEALGYDSLWRTQAFGRGYAVLDPFVALSVAASATSQVELGTAILQLPLYAPADVAHRALSLQQVCGNRLSLGVGAGSDAAEFAAFGREHTRRFADFDAGLVALREHLRLGAVGSVELIGQPMRVQPPRLLLGSWGARVEAAAIGFDAWIASGRYRDDDQLATALARYRAAGGTRAIVSTVAVGSDRNQLAARLRRLEAMGFDDAVVLFDGESTLDAAVVRALVE